MSPLGLVLYHGIDSGAELREYGRIAEDNGFDSLWVTERYFHEETFSLLGFLAAATQRLTLGVGVVNPYTRNPALLAMASATLDRISGGRFVLGLGRSEKAVIQDKMGIPYGDSRAALIKTVSQLRKLFAGERVTTQEGCNKLQAVKLATTPIQPQLPIYLAGIGTKGLRLVGEIADGVVLNAYVPPAYVRYAVAEIRAAAAAAGRDPNAIDIACMLVIRLTDDPAKMRATLKQRIVRLFEEPYVGEILLDKGGFDPSILPRLRAIIKSDGEKAAVPLITDAMVDAFYVVGSATQCQERIAEYRQAGVTTPLLLPRLEDYGAVATTLNNA
ncbi:MAG: LLM class flavin-dependent oxidoreductase [Deltaproteobacteria bacterium]|nr:LLM class flavin-dependent oxidoreductase [Deltaproteobacteria bacterium]